jgi:succinate dehydrogenase / fumarate reductase flavoprotein subunit
MYHQFKELAEIDITRQPMEVGPTLHYFMGGIRVDADTQATSVPGLFACGECTSGVHGANRLGGNSLSDLLVFGKLAADGAAEFIKREPRSASVSQNQVESILRRARDPLNREKGLNPFMVHEDLQAVMQRYVGIVRTRAELEKALQELKRLEGDAANAKAHATSQYNPGWNEALDLSNLLVTAEAVTRSALEREESRGAHTRVDFADERDEWLKVNVVVRKGEDGRMQVRKATRPEPPKELAEIARATLEALEGTHERP